MFVRQMVEDDYFDVAVLHSLSKLDYRLPDLDSPLIIAKHVMCDDSGRIIGAGIYRVQAEAYLWLDFCTSPLIRCKVVSALSRSLAGELIAFGIDCAVAYLPASLPTTFRRFLRKIGWSSDRAGWQSWSLDLHDDHYR